MFVKAGAVQKLMQKRKDQFFDNYILSLVEEAKRLQLSEEDVKFLIERGFKNEYRN